MYEQSKVSISGGAGLGREKIDQFDQVVAFRWSEGDRANQQEWFESSLIILNQPKVSRPDTLTAVVEGHVAIPCGVPEVTSDGQTSIAVRLELKISLDGPRIAQLKASFEQSKKSIVIIDWLGSCRLCGAVHRIGAL